MVASKGPIVNAGHNQKVGSQPCLPPHDSQQRIVADGQHQPPCETCRRPAAKRQPEVVDDAFQPCRPA